jgi:DNA-binding protein H-NS
MAGESLAQLQSKYDELEKNYKIQRSALEKQMAQVRKLEQAGAVEKIRSIMAEYGLAPADLGTSQKSKLTKKTSTVEAKFRGPNGETWTGRGRQPRWVGDDREKFRIK